MNVEALLAERVRSVEASGIRRVFDLAGTLKDPIDLSIGQPDFPPPERMRRAAIEAIESGKNGYTPSSGIPDLRRAVWRRLEEDLGWREGGAADVMVTSGTLGAITLAFMALLDPGDEVILPDPYFVAYPHLATLVGAKPVLCDTYPDFRMTAERIEPLITRRTKAVLLNSPSNPSGVCLTQTQCDEVLELCRSKNVMLLSDEIYDEFVYKDGKDPTSGRAASAGRGTGRDDEMLVIRGFGKSYGCTGWRMGYAAGPKALISEMIKAQQYTFVCAPSIAQWGCMPAFECDISETIATYQRRRDMVVERLSEVTEIARPGGAFFVFPKAPRRFEGKAIRLVEEAVERSVLIINGGVFSSRDTHFRISYAQRDDKLERGIDVLVDLLKG